MIHDFNNILTDLRFWDQIRGDAKRTIFCAPGQAEDIRHAVEAAGGQDIITVTASHAVADGKAYIADMQAIEAEHQQAMLRSVRGWL